MQVDALREWLAAPAATTMRPGQQRRRVWPMPRDVRLAAPDAPRDSFRAFGYPRWR